MNKNELLTKLLRTFWFTLLGGCGGAGDVFSTAFYEQKVNCKNGCPKICFTWRSRAGGIVFSAEGGRPKSISFWLEELAVAGLTEWLIVVVDISISSQDSLTTCTITQTRIQFLFKIVFLFK